MMSRRSWWKPPKRKTSQEENDKKTKEGTIKKKMSKEGNVEIKSRRRKMSKVKHLKEKRWVKFQDVSNKTLLVLFLLIQIEKKKQYDKTLFFYSK
jgi:hypothetical protein